MSEPQVDMTKWADRAATPEEVQLAQQADLPEGPKPIAVFIPAIDIRMLYAARTSPEQFNQCILARLKDAGAPVEGTIHLKLAHGAVAKKKSNPLVDEGGFTYLWLSEEYVRAIMTAKGGVLG